MNEERLRKLLELGPDYKAQEELERLHKRRKGTLRFWADRSPASSRLYNDLIMERYEVSYIFTASEEPTANFQGQWAHGHEWIYRMFVSG